MAEGARLESVFTGNRNVGSNPTPSANHIDMVGLFLIYSTYVRSSVRFKLRRRRIAAAYWETLYTRLERWRRYRHDRPLCSRAP